MLRIYSLSLHDALPILLAAVDFASLSRQKGEWYEAIPPLCRSSTGLCPADYFGRTLVRSEDHTSELQSPCNLVCRLLLEKKKQKLSISTMRKVINDQQE